jgi:hypothetical protein
MKLRHRLAALAGVAAVTLVGSVLPATASAAFPRFSDCPLRGTDLGTCLNIVSPTGSMEIKGFRVPLHDAIEIRGGLSFLPDGSTRFVPPAGTNGFFANAVDVPGGLLGIDLPFGFTRVAATAQLAGSPSDIRIGLNDLTVSLPIKLKLSNTFLSSSCTIGTNANPVRLNLIVGTTSPPPPNRPISGRTGTPSFPGYLLITGSTNVDNSFAIPAANNCGIFQGGLIDTLINAKLKLPSAAGNNTMIVNNNVAVQPPQ